MSGGKSKRQVDQEWERRVLCSDEACIGTIGPDGACKECGKPYEGELPDHFSQNPKDEDASGPSRLVEAASSDETDEVDTDEVEAQDEDGADSPDGDDDWGQRTLCSDESCIGVIGPDGLCKECGKPLEG